MKLATLIPILTLAVAACAIAVGGTVVLVQKLAEPDLPPPAPVVKAEPHSNPRCGVWRDPNCSEVK